LATLKEKDMNTKYKYLFRAMLFCTGLSITLTSCLEDNDFDKYTTQAVANRGSQPVISVGTTATGVSEFLALALEAKDKDTTLNMIPVVLNAADVASEDIQVTMEADTVFLKNYNKANGTNYTMPTTKPAFTLLDNGIVTIKKGESVGYLKIKLKTADYLGGPYAFSYKIAKVSNAGYIISGNHASSAIAVLAKNRFDGVYTLTGSMTDLANAALTGNYPTEVELRTGGTSQVVMWDKTGGLGLRHTILSGGSLSFYGSFGVVINFNNDNTVASVVNSYGQPAANGRSAELDPSGVNKWDPKTKTLKIKYWMNQPSVIPGHRTSFDETFTFKEAR
jgi:Domain of unknown function (DUF1735)